MPYNPSLVALRDIPAEQGDGNIENGCDQLNKEPFTTNLLKEGGHFDAQRNALSGPQPRTRTTTSPLHRGSALMRS